MTSNQPEATMTHDGDVELVTRTLQGDAVAFGTLVERGYPLKAGHCMTSVI